MSYRYLLDNEGCIMLLFITTLLYISVFIMLYRKR